MFGCCDQLDYVLVVRVIQKERKQISRMTPDSPQRQDHEYLRVMFHQGEIHRRQMTVPWGGKIGTVRGRRSWSLALSDL